MKKLHLSHFKQPRITNRKELNVPSDVPGLILPRGEIVKAIAKASYDGNPKACAAGWRLLKAIDESDRDYLRV